MAVAGALVSIFSVSHKHSKKIGWKDALYPSLILLTLTSLFTFSLKGGAVIRFGLPYLVVLAVLFYSRDRKVVGMQKQADQAEKKAPSED